MYNYTLKQLLKMDNPFVEDVMSIKFITCGLHRLIHDTYTNNSKIHDLDLCIRAAFED